MAKQLCPVMSETLDTYFKFMAPSLRCTYQLMVNPKFLAEAFTTTDRVLEVWILRLY